METRTVTQVKVFTLQLNPMMDRCEATNLVALAYDKDKLIEWYESLIVEPYKDADRWHKVFKKGSELEWYNPLTDSMYGEIKEEWTTQEAIDFYLQRANDSLGFLTIPKIIE